jgi:hypothetical protein
MRISATYKDGEEDKATAELRAVAFYSAKEMYVHVETSTEYGQLGENVVIHLRSNFGFQVYSYVVSSFVKILCSWNFVYAQKMYDFPGSIQRFGDPRSD